MINQLKDSITHLESQLRTGEGKWLVNARVCDSVTSCSHLLFKSQECLFASVLGLQKTANGDLIAMPLAWSPGRALTNTERYSQYSNFCRALQVALGFSESEIKHNRKLRIFIGLKKPANSFRRLLSHYSESQLRDLLQTEEITKMCQTKDITPLLIDNEEVMLSLSKDVNVEAIQGVALVTHELDGGVTAISLQVGKKRAEMAMVLMSTLLQIWSLRADQDPAMKQDPIYKDYMRVNSIAKKAKVAQELLDNPDLREGKAGQCPECGQVFNLVTALDREQFKMHKKRHFYEDFKCDCEVTWSTFNGKKKHVLLCHAEGENIKCAECEYVSGVKGMAGHMKRSHEKMTCEHCSAVLTGSIRLESHKESFHPEHSKTGGKKVRQGGGTCDICGEYFKRLKTHIEVIHNKSDVCECDICGKTFTRANGLRRHRIQIHFPEQMKIHCKLCDAR